MNWRAKKNHLLSRVQSLFHSHLFKGGLWAVVGKAFGLPISLLISFLLPRILSPNDMGVFIFAESVVLSGSVVAQLGLGPTTVRLIAGPLSEGKFDSVRENIRNLLQWGLAGAITVVISINLLRGLIGVESIIAIWISLWIVVLVFQKLFTEVLRGFNDIRAAVLVGDSRTGGLISYIASSIMLFLAWRVFGHVKLTFSLFIMVIAGSSAVILALFLLRRKLRDLNYSKTLPGRNFSFPLLISALPVLIHTLATILQNQSGIWMLKTFQSASEVALFGVASKFLIMVTLPLQIVTSVVSPLITKLYWRDETDKLERILRGLSTLSALPVITVLIVFTVGGSTILSILFGEYYRAANDLLMILMFGNAFHVMAGSCGLTLVMTGHQKTLMGISLFSGISTSLAAYLVADRFGTLGVASVISVVLILKNVLMLIYTKRLTGIWTHAALRLDRRTITNLLNLTMSE